MAASNTQALRVPLSFTYSSLALQPDLNRLTYLRSPSHPFHLRKSTPALSSIGPRASDASLNPGTNKNLQTGRRRATSLALACSPPFLTSHRFSSYTVFSSSFHHSILLLFHHFQLYPPLPSLFCCNACPVQHPRISHLAAPPRPRSWVHLTSSLCFLEKPSLDVDGQLVMMCLWESRNASTHLPFTSVCRIRG